MAIENRTTSQSPISPSNASAIMSLRSSISKGSTIRASHMRSLRDLITSVRNHTHSYTDEITRSTFGNTGSNSSTTRTTGLPSGSNPNISDQELSVGGTVKISHYNSLKISANELINHTHSFTDTY